MIIVYGGLVWYFDTGIQYNDQVKVFSVSLTSNIYHFLMVKTFKILSFRHSEIYSKLLIVLCCVTWYQNLSFLILYPLTNIPPVSYLPNTTFQSRQKSKPQCGNSLWTHLRLCSHDYSAIKRLLTFAKIQFSFPCFLNLSCSREHILMKRFLLI
jgi:hypothetical protein